MMETTDHTCKIRTYTDHFTLNYSIYKSFIARNFDLRKGEGEKEFEIQKEEN